VRERESGAVQIIAKGKKEEIDDGKEPRVTYS
jgi:hypothetical protein